MFNHLEQFFESLWDKLLNERKDISKGGSADDPASSREWDSWELDPKFFKALSQWTIDHPETTLDGVLANICDGIDRGTDLLEVIPDSPFPARSLVKALGSLVKLGVSVARAKADVRAFAQDIIHWVSEMRVAFESSRGGRFTYRTKKNLKKIRALIDEICKWATARLNDGRWSRITHGLSIAHEIDEFKDRIASARAIFMNISMINISHGLDDIIREIDKVRKLQQVQLKNIQDSLHEQKQAEERRRFLSQTLFKRTVVNATYDEQGKQPCDADTRTVILADIKTWIYDMSDSSQSFLWLTGDPGSGKSAITASVARECKDAGILWAQFFINRNNADTTDPRSYFPSIARQLADHIPDSVVAVAIHDALKLKPSLVDDISTDQASRLFLDAIDAASKLDPRKPVVVVIDGLDETDRPRLGVTADIFAKLFAKLRCRNAKVFISSRTEDDIQRPFSQAFDVRHVGHIHLDTSVESSMQDVSSFLRRRIAEIVEKNDLNWEIWPGEERMQALCFRAAGLFIWAATVVKFFQEQIEAMGRECLNELLDALSTKGMGDINVLYGAILHLLYKDRKDAWAYETFRRVVGCIVVLREPLCLTDIEDLLDLRQATSSERVDIKHFVRRLRTVLVAGTDAIDGRTVPRLHKSFFEFITSKRANGNFRVDLGISHGELAVQCLLQLAKAGEKQSTAHDNDSSVNSLPFGLWYALQFWSLHLVQDRTVTSGVAMIGNNVQLPELLTLLRNGRYSKPVNVTFSPDRAQIVMSWENIIRRWDRAHYQPIKEHTANIQSVAFSPDGKRVVSGGNDKTIRIWDSQSGQPIGPCFYGHSSNVLSVAFSPDGMRVISASGDGTIRIWDLQSGTPISPPFEGHTDAVWSATFSGDGKQVVSGGSDHTVRVWDTQSRQPIGLPFQGHTEAVLSVALSPDGKRIVSSDYRGTMIIWDLQSGKPVGSSWQGHTSPVWSVAFSPDGKWVVSGSADNTVRIWDSQTRQPIGSPLKGHTGCVGSVSFSPNGERLVSGSNDHTIRVWDSQSQESIGSPFRGHTDAVRSVAFSPDGKRFASGSWDRTVLVWDMQREQRHTADIRAIACSPDGTYIVSVSSDNAIRFWKETGLPIDILLEGNKKELISITISPDGSRIAIASLDGTIYLLDAATRVLVSPPIKNSVDGFTSLTFSPDGSRLIVASIDGSTCLRNAADGKLIESFSDTSLVGKKESFNMQQGWNCSELDEGLLQWFPSDVPSVGLWACVGGKVIRSNGDGSVTIIVLND